MKQNSEHCRTVSRNGRVVERVDGLARVQFVQESACASCHLKRVCSPSDVAERIVDVRTNQDLSVGMPVQVRMPERHGWLGVLFAFVLPLGIVVGAIFGADHILGSQEAAALLGIGFLFVYYAALYAIREVFERIVSFEAIPLKEGSS